MTESVIMVDANDNELGEMQKMEAHFKGVLHRAFSVFIFNTNGELLLQQRALNKYHSGGKWTNTCCSHPRKGERTQDAANRRLQEEMGMSCHLNYGFNFTYNVEIMEGLYEHELDHVYFGTTDVEPIPNADEVLNYRYITMEDLENELIINPDEYTVWLKICFDLVKDCYKNILTL